MSDLADPARFIAAVAGGGLVEIRHKQPGGWWWSAYFERPADRWKHPDKPESWVSFHTLRHTCASLLFEAGRDIRQVQEWLGHEDPGFTLRTYVHLMDNELGDADFLDRAVVVVEPEPAGAAT